MVGKVRRRWWVPKIIASDLSGLIQMPLRQSQDRKADRHASKQSTDSVVSLRVRPMYSCASSAYCWWEMPWSETICLSGEIYSEKSRGPRTDPCGTPDTQQEGSDETDPMHTVWVRLVRYDVSQARAVPLTPKLVERRERSVEWSMVSNAALRSKETRRVGWLQSAELKILLKVWRRAVSVEWWGR